jgi:predicted DNA-binding transcriptional regulator AlpA
MSTKAISVVNNSEAARHLGLSESTLNKLRLTGGGPVFIKLGRRVLYNMQDLEAWLQQHRRTSTSDLGKANDR